MPRGVYTRTPEHNKKNSEAKKRLKMCPPSRKGNKLSQETKDKISKSLTGHNGWNKGKKWTDKQKKGLSIIRKEMGTIPPSPIGRKHSQRTRRNMSISRIGCLGSNWQGGKTTENKKIRNNIDSRLWREAVFARDNFTCQKTGIRGGKLNAHHILNFSQYPELRFAIDNGITLSDDAHKEFHKIYGTKNNNLEQLTEFLNNSLGKQNN